MDKKEKIKQISKYVCKACEMLWGCDMGVCPEFGVDGYKICGIAKETAELIYNECFDKGE